MTDRLQPQTTPGSQADTGAPPQNLVLIKLVTAFLGLLLVGGVALLAILLFLRDGGGDAPAALPPITLAPGEVVTDASVGEGGLVLLIGDAGGPSRVLIVDPETGEQASLPVIITQGAPLTDR